MTKDELLKDLLGDIAELDAPWDLITDTTEGYIQSLPQDQRNQAVADYTIRISQLHALEAIAKGIAVIAQKENS
jgi:hypothetical protein